MMLKSKYFWIAMVILVPFIVVWVMEGFGWAIATLVIMGLLFLFILGSTRRRKRHPYYDVYDDYGDDRDINININYGEDEERRPRRTAHIPPIVPINKKGARFIIGDSQGFRKREQDAMRSLRERQEKDMRRIKKNLWG